MTARVSSTRGAACHALQVSRAKTKGLCTGHGVETGVASPERSAASERLCISTAC